MNPEDAQRDRKALEIFGRAVELASAEARAACLEGACGGDATLKARVEALLANHVEDSFLQQPAASLGPGATAFIPVTEQPGDRIGRYKLLQEIGEGGMGVVYMAEQEEPVRRQVALKVIKLGMDSRSVVARFEAERQALAMMDHPNIAKVLDAGTTDTGRPYFVMELVGGIRITDYCDQNNLPTGDRLDLFIKVCHAVQHAHQKGIIHRDLKPSNILVTLHDGVPVPKVIDFGVAKATEGRLTDATVYTQLHQFMGTPAYMSPEQAEMGGLDIDTRSDIYSLGVLLYELLTGVTPFDGQTLVQSGLDEMRRIIRETEPPKPSTRLTQTARAASGATGHAAKSQPSGARQPADGSPKGIGGSREQILNLKSQIDPDLDWIVMKCLEKDRTRRYETANGLAADLTRHLSNEPVVARPPGAAYRFGKLVRRNKFAFAAGSAVAAALIAGLAMALLALARERAANERAEQQRSLAEQRLLVAAQHVEGFLTNDLMEVRKLPGSTRPVERMLQNTLTFMDALAPVRTDHPEFLLASAKMHAALARAQGSVWGMSLGKPEAALASASNAWSLLQAIRVGALPETRRREMMFQVEEASGMALEALGREDEALEHYRRMLPLAAELDRDLPRANDCLWSSTAHLRLGALYMTYSQLELMREETAHLLRDPYLLTDTASGDPGRLLFTSGALFLDGVYYESVSNWNAALDRFRQGLAFCEAYLERSNADQLMEYHAALSLFRVGYALWNQGNYVEGIPTIDEARRRLEALANRDKENWVFQDLMTSSRVGCARARIAASKQTGLALTERSRLLDEARDLTLDWMQAPASSTRMKTAVIHKPEDIARELSEAYRSAGKLDDAEAIYRKLLARPGSDLTPALNLGELLLERARTNTENPSLAQKQKSEGEQLLRDYLANARKRYANDPANLEDGLQHLAEVRYRRGDFAEAEPLYRELVQSRHARLGAEDEGVISPTASLGRLLADWAWAERDPTSDPRPPTSGAERAREAEKHLRECLAIRLRGTNSTHWRTADMKSRLGGALVSVAVADPALNAEARGAKLAEAESLLLEGNEALQQSSAESKYKRDAVERLVRLYGAWGQRDKVSEWQQKLETFDKTGNEPSPSEEQKTQ